LMTLFLFISAYVFFPWVQMFVQKYGSVPSVPNAPTIVTLETSSLEHRASLENSASLEHPASLSSKPFALYEFVKRFVLYQIQPIFHCWSV
jgi:hypothetical protein